MGEGARRGGRKGLRDREWGHFQQVWRLRVAAVDMRKSDMCGGSWGETQMKSQHIR